MNQGQNCLHATLMHVQLGIMHAYRLWFHVCTTHVQQLLAQLKQEVLTVAPCVHMACTRSSSCAFM